MEIVDLVFGFIEKIPGWLWPVTIITVLFTMLVFHLTLGARRGALWQQTALLLGYAHQDEDTRLANTLGSLNSFLDVDGFETRSMDVLSKDEDGIQKWLLDHAAGKPRKIRTACVMRSRELQLPHFTLLPAGGWLRSREETIHFQEDPEFSRIFALTTDNPTAIKHLFDHKLRQHFLRMFHHCREIEKSNTDWFSALLLRLSSAIGVIEVEAVGETLSVHLSRIINPRGAAELLAVTATTFEILKTKP